jgi:plasmid stabilization system protein ParE
MRIIWNLRAKEAKHQVALYIRRRFGLKREKKFLQEVDRTAEKLLRNPFIGKIDPLFADRSITYRSVIVNNLNKMVYYVKDDTIRIAAFWDTRMEPTNQAAQTD